MGYDEPMTRVARILLFCVLIGAPCHAAATPQPSLVGTWYFSWSGIPFAKLWLSVQPEGDGSVLVASFKSRGIVRLFDSMKTLSKGHLYHQGEQISTAAFVFDDADEGKHTTLRFNMAGELTHRTVTPEDDPSHRPPVPAHRVKGAATPADALFALAAGYRAAEREGKPSFTRLFYDGKRLMKVKAALLPERDYAMEGGTHKVKVVALSRRLVAGFTEKEQRRHAEGEPPVYLFLSAQTLHPIAMEAQIKLGTMKAYWVAE